MIKIALSIINCVRLMIIAGLIIGLCACQRQPSRVEITPSLPCRVYGSSDLAIMQMQDNFNKAGIKTISMGQNFLVSIPSSYVFATNSPRVKWEGYGVLNDVSCYLKQFRKVAVTVRSYSNQCISYDRDQALTLTRARAVGQYLSEQGIDSRLIFTEGLGSDKPIVNNRQGGDNSINSRIEITFRRTVA